MNRLSLPPTPSWLDQPLRTTIDIPFTHRSTLRAPGDDFRNGLDEDNSFCGSNWMNNYNNSNNNLYAPPNEEANIANITREPKGSETRTVTIKASYKEDIIRFRISSGSGIMELKEEVAKRLKLDAATFDIKYLDDDNEWFLIACDADLQECLEIPRYSRTNIVRLLVHDVTTNLGSSCESTGEL